MRRKIILAVIFFHGHASFSQGSRFSMNGPSLTVTLKDSDIPKNHPNQGYTSFFPRSATNENINDEEADESYEDTRILKKVIGISGLNPSVAWGMQSLGKPFPKWMPFVKSLSMRSGLSYDNRGDGNFVESQMILGSSVEDKSDLTVSLNPRYQLSTRKADLLIAVGTSGGKVENLKSAARGGFFGLLRFTSKGKKLLEFARASYKTSLPFTTISSITVTPAFDFTTSSPSCVLEGESGTGRTSAKLDLNWDSDSTLTVIHSLDAYNTIAPEISLTSAKIMYNWDVALSSSGSSIRTRVDPTSAIQIIWTDVTDGGQWVTNFKLPLDGNTNIQGGRGIFAADINVRRQFKF